MVNAARNNDISKFLELYAASTSQFSGLGKQGVWNLARDHAGVGKPPAPKPKTLNTFKIGNGLYRMGNNVYMAVGTNSKIFAKNGKYYMFTPNSENWQGKYPAKFYEIPRKSLQAAPAPRNTFGNVGYVHWGGGKYGKVFLKNRRFNLWNLERSDATYRKTNNGTFVRRA